MTPVKKYAIKFILIIVIMFLIQETYSQSVFIGPTFHYNIGGGIKKSSFGFEVSYWQWEGLRNFIPLGFDWGIEFEKGKTRVYSEFQGGIIYGGSIGYVHEFTKEYSKGGIQGSAWGAIFGGIELRFRRINNTNFFSPGLFFKVPVTKKGPDFC